MNNYPIGDFVTRLKNASLARKKEVMAPYSRAKEAIADILLKAGYLDDVRRDSKTNTLIVNLAYKQSLSLNKQSLSLSKKRLPIISGTKIISKPGIRVYKDIRGIQKMAKDPGVIIISTSLGIMGDKEAIKRKVGGEIIARVW